MAEEHKQQSSSSRKSRRERVEYARSRDILDVANEMNMELVRSGRDYRWKEHDSMVISPDKNMWNWFSRHQGGDVISLVETMKEVKFNQAIDYLNDGSFKEYTSVERVQEPFFYYLEPYEQPFEAARTYLKEQRGLSDETIDFFLEKGVLTQANAKVNGSIEPVVVFKSFDFAGEIVGATLQGIEENWEKWPERGYAKNIVRNSDGITGLHVDIGQPNRLIFAESAIDLMSYYELHNDSLQDVRLVSMDGLKEAVVGRHLMQLQAEIKSRPLRWTHDQLAEGLQTAIDNNFFTDGKHADWITLAVDNDEGGRNFIDSLREKGATINEDLPDLQSGQDKTDWNDVLKNQQEEKMDNLKSKYEQTAEKTVSESSHFPDTSHLSPEDATWLKENWNNISFSVQSTRPSETDPTTEEKHISGHQESIANTEENAGRMMSYEEVKRENEALTKKLNNRVQSGELSIEFAPDFYLYDVFAKLGNSHPTKYLNDKRMEVMSPIHSLLTSIDDQTIDLYKKKGTPEQGSLYQALKPHQRTLGVDISTQFIGELAIAAYNTNKQIESLSSDSFGVYFGERTLDNLSQSIERMLEYPLIESGTRDFAYGFVTTQNTLFHYLEEQEGEVVLNRGLLGNLISRLDTRPIKIMEALEEKEKSLEGGQETTNNSEQDKKNETKLRDFSEQAQEAAPLPEVSESQPLKDLSPSQTESHSLLYFTINKPEKSIYKENYHPIKHEELNKLNRHTDIIQDAAQWYLDNLSDTTIHYFYLQGDKQYNININFQQHHFMHLTGLFPIKSNQTAVKTLHDFAEGRGEYDNILVSNKGATFQKIKVLPDLKSILETESFYFDQVEDIPKLKSLSMEKAIQSEDKDIVLALSSNNENIYPASLMELTDEFRIQIKNSLHQNVILGIFQEKDGEIHKVAINKNYIEDDGKRMLSVLKNKQYEEVSKELKPPVPENTRNKISLDSATFTQVLDTVYNLGVPGDTSKTPEEFHQAWNQYLDYAKKYNDKFDQIVAAAGEDNLLDINTDFYKEWQQDHIYKENYHVRLQWSEERPEGPILPFKETDLISYQDFARELYKVNQDFYPINQEGMKQVIAGNTEGYNPPTKIKFDIYAPGGKVIKEGIRYDIGDETEPISRLLGLGYRRLEGQPELAAIDEKILSQLENQEINQDIATEANEQVVTLQEIPESTSREDFQSPKQDIRTGLAQRVQEPNQRIQENISSAEPFDYKSASAYEISERAFQKIREYTQSPEDLMEYVEFMSKFPQLSPRNVALIQEQWRGANAVATYDQWQSMGEALGIKPEDVIQTKATYVNKRTCETKEVVHRGLSVKTGEKSQITLFRPLMVRMIPVIDENGNHVKNDKGNPKYKKFSDATPQEKELVKAGKLPVRQFQERNPKTGQPRFTTYKVFELSQTTLKPESYPKAMPNRHYNFDVDKVKTKEVLEGLCDYAESIGVSIMKDEAHVLGNTKGAFFPQEQLILINPDNTPGEKIATTIHELAHATLHNPSLSDQYKELPKVQKELEAEMTSHLLSKHFGLDTSEKAIDYMAKWTDNLQGLDDKQLADSLKRIHKTVSKMHKQIEHHTKPYQLGKSQGQTPNFPKAPTKGPSR